MSGPVAKQGSKTVGTEAKNGADLKRFPFKIVIAGST